MRKRACIVRQNYYHEDLLVRREAQALKEAGFDVDVICAASPRRPREEMVDGIHLYHLPPQRKKGNVARYLFEYGAFFFLTALKLTLLHLQRPYALIQVNTMPDFLVFATLIPRLLGARVTLQMYEPMPELWLTKSGLTPLIRFLELIQRWSLRYAHAAFAVTQQLKDSFVARGADPDKITVLLNVPDPRFFQVGDTDPLPSPDGHFTLICHGAIEERYGHDTMLEAVDALRAVLPNLRLRILGKGSYLPQFLAQTKALGLQDRVEYLGYVSFSQMVNELRRADAGIVAQKSSPYSNLVHTGKMYDYLCFHKPVIASRLRAVNAYFDDESLCYFTPEDAKDLARAIRYLWEHPQARETFARNGRRLYERYRWEQQRAAYIAVSRRLVGLESAEATQKVDPKNRHTKDGGK
jgi:glycosyltransferase involved in cell wall biosynthesis